MEKIEDLDILNKQKIAILNKIYNNDSLISEIIQHNKNEEEQAIYDEYITPVLKSKMKHHGSKYKPEEYFFLETQNQTCFVNTKIINE